MKDITISAKRQKHELLTWLVCFAISFVLNVYAIIAYESSAIELVTSLLYVICFSLVLYVAWGCLRIIGHFVFKNTKHNNKKQV